MKLIKQAAPGDLEVIHELAHKIWPVAYGDILSPEQLTYMLELIYSLPALRHQLMDLKHNFLIVFDEEDPMAFASFSEKASNSKTYRLHKIYVSSQQQGTGMGKLLLSHIIDSVKSSGGAFLELNVNRHNKALDFYKKFGFKIIDEEDIDIGKGYFMNDFIMRLAVE
ncbi:MAG: GNAT family N-acetyltransferase [Ginsengibacter sp.]